MKTLDKQIRLTTLWSRHWRRTAASDLDVWSYITMRWPTLSQKEKQRIFHSVTNRTYKHYIPPIDRTILTSKYPFAPGRRKSG